MDAEERSDTPETDKDDAEGGGKSVRVWREADVEADEGRVAWGAWWW